MALLLCVAACCLSRSCGITILWSGFESLARYQPFAEAGWDSAITGYVRFGVDLSRAPTVLSPPIPVVCELRRSPGLVVRRIASVTAANSHSARAQRPAAAIRSQCAGAVLYCDRNRSLSCDPGDPVALQPGSRH